MEKKPEQVKAASADTVRLSVNLSNESLKDLERVRELLAHSLPGAAWGEVVAHLAKEFLRRKDPLCQLPRSRRAAASAAVSPRARGKTMKFREIFQRDKGSCQFRDPQTGRICGARFGVEIDHIVPRTLGGDDSPENLRCLCRQHNQLEAERKLGKQLMARFSGGSG